MLFETCICPSICEHNMAMYVVKSSNTTTQRPRASELSITHNNTTTTSEHSITQICLSAPLCLSDHWRFGSVCRPFPKFSGCCVGAITYRRQGAACSEFQRLAIPESSSDIAARVCGWCNFAVCLRNCGLLHVALAGLNVLRQHVMLALFCVFLCFFRITLCLSILVPS